MCYLTNLNLDPNSRTIDENIVIIILNTCMFSHLATPSPPHHHAHCPRALLLDGNSTTEDRQTTKPCCGGLTIWQIGCWYEHAKVADGACTCLRKREADHSNDCTSLSHSWIYYLTNWNIDCMNALYISNNLQTYLLASWWEQS